MTPEEKAEMQQKKWNRDHVVIQEVRTPLGINVPVCNRCRSAVSALMLDEDGECNSCKEKRQQEWKDQFAEKQKREMRQDDIAALLLREARITGSRIIIRTA